MTALNYKLVLGLLLGLTAAGAVVYSATALGGARDGDKKAEAPGAPAAKVNVVRVPSPEDGILIVIGTEVKEKAAKGRIIKVRIGKEERQYRKLREGDKVEAGQMVAQLEDRLARNEVAYRKAKLAAAKADHQVSVAMAREAEARLKRLNDLKRRAPQAVSEEEYLAAVLTKERYRQEEIARKEGVKAAEAELQRAQIVLEMYTIRSPVSGVIRMIHWQCGEGVRRLDTLLEIQPIQGN
jgi:multidrug efflux pump subunit AcrA (membrane-fusion protein)